MRDSYFVATEGPEATDFYDVFLLDQDFAIERPKRVYRTGLHLMTGQTSVRAIRKKETPMGNEKGEARGGIVSDGGSDDEGIDLDNPFAREMVIASGEGTGQKLGAPHEDGDEHHASQHTFFIVNEQRRLKLVAKNAVSWFRHVRTALTCSDKCINSSSAWSVSRPNVFGPVGIDLIRSPRSE